MQSKMTLRIFRPYVSPELATPLVRSSISTLRYEPGLLGWFVMFCLLLALVISSVLGTYYWKSKPAAGSWSGTSFSAVYPQPVTPTKPSVVFEVPHRHFHLDETRPSSYMFPPRNPTFEQGSWVPINYPPPTVYDKVPVYIAELPSYVREPIIELRSIPSYIPIYIDSIAGGGGTVTVLTDKPVTTPVPEPSSWMILGAGLALISCRAWRVRRRQP